MIVTDRDDIEKLRAVIECHVAQQRELSAAMLAGYPNPRIRTAAASDNPGEGATRMDSTA
jgi:hypothetical protein